MIKHPALRVKSIQQVAPEILDEVEADVEYCVGLSPYADLIVDLEILGSYATGRARLHSDLDINLATGSQEQIGAAIARIRENVPAHQISRKWQFKELQEKWGLRFQTGFMFPLAKTNPNLMCYSLKERKLYGTNPIKQARYDVQVVDADTGEMVPLIPDENDPYLKELPEWRAKYGANLLEFGETPETAHMKARMRRR